MLEVGNQIHCSNISPTSATQCSEAGFSFLYLVVQRGGLVCFLVLVWFGLGFSVLLCLFFGGFCSNNRVSK